MLTFIDNTPDEVLFHYYVNGHQIGNVTIPASPGIGGMVSTRIDSLIAGGTTRVAVSAATPIGETALSDEVDVTTPFDSTNQPPTTGNIVIEEVAPVWSEYNSFGASILHWSIPNEPVLLQAWQGISLTMCNRSDVPTTIWVSSFLEMTPLWAADVQASEGVLMGHYWNFDSSGNPQLESQSDMVDALPSTKTFNGVTTRYDTSVGRYEPLVLISSCVHFDLPWVDFGGAGTFHYRFSSLSQLDGGPSEDDYLVLTAQCEQGPSSPVCTFSEAYEP
jgi:hypothetical protein